MHEYALQLYSSIWHTLQPENENAWHSKPLHREALDGIIDFYKCLLYKASCLIYKLTEIIELFLPHSQWYMKCDVKDFFYKRERQRDAIINVQQIHEALWKVIAAVGHCCFVYDWLKSEKKNEKMLLNEFWNLKSAQYMKGFLLF